MSPMGLEIYYDLHAPASWRTTRVRRVLDETRAFAAELGFSEVGEVVAMDAAAPDSIGMKDPPEGKWPRAKAIEGWEFRTWPGEGCETAYFGLSRFPPTVELDGDLVPHGWGPGWHYHTWCKTQYADRHGREHFLRCHCGVASVLRHLAEAGCEVNARDGGGYWPTRDLAALKTQIEGWNRTVATFAGRLKDAAGDEHEGKITAPIFERADFERLEAEGEAELRRKSSDSRRKEQ